jgi:Adenosine-deaminase (editase) domain
VAGRGPGLRVVAVGTGTKCLAGEARSPGGELLNDSHAEARADACLLLVGVVQEQREFFNYPYCWQQPTAFA